MPRYRKAKIFEIGGWWLDGVAGSPFWYAFRYDADAGRVCRESLGVDDLETAKLAISTKALIACPKEIDSYLSSILEDYFQNVSDAKPSGPQARYAGGVVLEFWGDTARASDISDKRQKAFAEWSRDRKHSISYIARNLSVLSAALRHSLGDRAPKVWSWPGTVAEKIGAAEPEPREWIPSDVQLAAFLDSLATDQSEHVLRYCILALNTLARPGAILELTPGQVDHALGLINLNPAGRKQTKKRRPIVRLPGTLKPWLADWGGDDDELYVFYHGYQIARVRHTFKRRGEALGIPELTPYSLRHKMATELRARGVSREELAYQMGHKLPDLRTTDRYTKFDKRYLATAMTMIEQYIGDLNQLTKRNLFQPDTPKILPRRVPTITFEETEIPLGSMVGAAWIEHATPTMST
jgi:integrase